jgi:hypothetical protein
MRETQQMGVFQQPLVNKHALRDVRNASILEPSYDDF